MIKKKQLLKVAAHKVVNTPADIKSVGVHFRGLL